MTNIVYVIRKGEHAPYKLMSVVDTSFGGKAENFICEGSRDYCSEIKRKLERK